MHKAIAFTTFLKVLIGMYGVCGLFVGPAPALLPCCLGTSHATVYHGGSQGGAVALVVWAGPHRRPRAGAMTRAVWCGSDARLWVPGKVSIKWTRVPCESHVPSLCDLRTVTTTAASASLTSFAASCYWLVSCCPFQCGRDSNINAKSPGRETA
jgi:hypothetical protein